MLKLTKLEMWIMAGLVLIIATSHLHNVILNITAAMEIVGDKPLVAKPSLGLGAKNKKWKIR